VFGGDGVIGRIFRTFVAGTEDLTALDAAAGEQYRLTRRPVIAASPVRSARARVSDFRLAAHLTRYEYQSGFQQAALVEVVQERGERPVERFHQKFEVQTPTDGYVVVRVDGDKPLTPVVGDGKTFTAYPFALTNPVFLDVDGDGKYRASLPHGHGK